MNDKRMNPVGWFEIYVADMKRAEGFYSALFGFSFSDMPTSTAEMPMRAFPGMEDHEAMGISGALIRHPEMGPGVGGTLVYFPSPSLKATLAKAKELGAPVHVDATSIGQYGNIAVIGDSEGNAIGIHSPNE